MKDLLGIGKQSIRILQTLSRTATTPHSHQVENMRERQEALQSYLDELLEKPFFHSHPEFLKFFEISRFSFVPDLGLKGKEGLVKKKSGGHQVGVGWYRGLKNLCPCLKPGW